MSKVFGYPEYDEKGEKILTTYDNEYKAMMMDIRVYRMKAGETKTFLREGEETAVLLLSGNITYKWNGNAATATRKDVFTEGPWCVHGCTGTEITVLAKCRVTDPCPVHKERERFWRETLQTGRCSMGIFQRRQIRKRGKEKSKYHL